jgi:hypothetical protein
MVYRKIKNCEAVFTSEQTFETVDDAMAEQNPTSDPTIKIDDVRVNNSRVKKDTEEVKKNVLGQ